mmetsp:Transcript_8515/g.7471  ORF Transcript_8515/g.7471 Transcript_8515/m.7471 type:complete len:105 (+) Transcript_8515:1171-1485(+)
MDLRTKLYNNIKLDDSFIVSVMAQIANALTYIHSNHVVHRDLKPENIFIAEGNVVKIIDFGLATLDHSGHLMDACGSITYIAPEVYLQEGYSIKVDIWALGVIG